MSRLTSDAATRYMRVHVAHKRLVGHYMQRATAELVARAIEHDASKWEPAEFDPYARQLPAFEKAYYGTPAYIAALKSIKPAIDHHFTMNRHHPEHFGEAGINGMNLLDVLEMACDWMAAAQRGGGTLADLRLDLQQKRFAIDEQLYGIICRTVDLLSCDSGGQ